jgi:hypothetical protein
MTTDPLFGSTALAERIERVETQLITTATEAARQRVGAGAFVVPIAGGAACYAEDGSPLNKIVALGFGGVPGDEALDEIEQAFAARATAWSPAAGACGCRRASRIAAVFTCSTPGRSSSIADAYRSVHNGVTWTHASPPYVR